MDGRLITFLAFLQESFSRGKSTVMQTSIALGRKFEEGGGQKSLHLSRGLLRNIKWQNGSTMTSTVGEVTQK